MTTTSNATVDADLALVKTGSGACGHGDASYEIYAPVTKGQTLSTPTYVGPSGRETQQAISHITYCRCE